MCYDSDDTDFRNSEYGTRHDQVDVWMKDVVVEITIYDDRSVYARIISLKTAKILESHAFGSDETAADLAQWLHDRKDY